MKLGVFGSRSIQDQRVYEILDSFLNMRPSFTTFVTAAEPQGVCTLAQSYARLRGLVLELHFLNTQKYARGAYEHRSDDIILSSDYILLIHDGYSQGTQNELERTQKFKRRFECKVISPTSEETIPIQQKRRVKKAEYAVKAENNALFNEMPELISIDLSILKG